MKLKPVASAAHRASKPRLSRISDEMGVRLPKALQRKKRGKTSLSIVRKTYLQRKLELVVQARRRMPCSLLLSVKHVGHSRQGALALLVLWMGQRVAGDGKAVDPQRRGQVDLLLGPWQ